MRGEHQLEQTSLLFLRGSSPHARGARAAVVSSYSFPGIIPACAGSTQSAFPPRRIGWDHPRMRGEHGIFNVAGKPLPGSSPHARGALSGKCSSRRRVGIIPACAGSTTLICSRKGGIQNHPRMRGEHQHRRAALSAAEGSSPHARGALGDGREDANERGIIPACAGSTLSFALRPMTIRDHPRMRGEHLEDGMEIKQVQGSSPHARGALNHKNTAVVCGGIIPACAGSTRPCPP